MGFEEVKKFKYKFKRISSINIELIEEFSCGLEELDKKLIQMKENDEGTTFVFLDETNGQIIGYCTYCASGLKKAYENDSITYPAAEIKYFAIDKTYQHKSYDDDFKFSDLMLCEVLKKLISEQVSVYRRTNVVKSEKFSEIMKRSLNAYLNGMLTNEEVIEEMLNLAKQIAAANKEGKELGLTADELAFYDALTKPRAIKDFYENEELIAITKELTETLRKNKTIDWQQRKSARAKMRMHIKKLLKKHKYPPEGMEDAVQTVMTQCELWTDNVMEV